jgi:methylamine dehydrogenase heavy chain
MSYRSLISAFALAACIATPALADLTPEELTRTELTPVLQPHWVWVNDMSLARLADGRAYLIDGDSGTMLGMISGGYGHLMLMLAPDGKSVAVPSTYYSRGSRGERTDVVTLYDSKTLTPGDEVIIPPKFFDGVPSIGIASLTDNGRFSILYNFTPEQSLTVVDLQEKRFVGETATAGCALSYPTGNHSFMQQCGDGSLQNVGIDDAGKLAIGAASPKLFEKNGPAMEKPVRISATDWLFFTFSGEVHQISGAGKAPERKAKWLLTDASTAGWRPGGTQPFAYHAASGRLFALMHQGGANTHKDPGSEVWVYDVKNRKLIQRLKLAVSATSIAVSGDDHPLLYTVMSDVEDLVIYDARSGAKLHTVGSLGRSLSYIQPAPVKR